jgi:outer membrane protein TolC
MEYYINLAHDSNPLLKSAKTNIDVADKNIEIIKTDKMPTIAGFGGYTYKDRLLQEILFWICIPEVGKQGFFKLQY